MERNKFYDDKTVEESVIAVLIIDTMRDQAWEESDHIIAEIQKFLGFFKWTFGLSPKEKFDIYTQAKAALLTVVERTTLPYCYRLSNFDAELCHQFFWGSIKPVRLSDQKALEATLVKYNRLYSSAKMIKPLSSIRTDEYFEAGGIPVTTNLDEISLITLRELSLNSPENVKQLSSLLKKISLLVASKLNRLPWDEIPGMKKEEYTGFADEGFRFMDSQKLKPLTFGDFTPEQIREISVPFVDPKVTEMLFKESSNVESQSEMSRQIHQERAAEEKPSPASNKNSELSEGYGFVTRSGCRENVQKQPQNNRDRDIGADSVPAGKSHLHSDDRSKAWHSDEESSGVPALVFFVGICGVFAFIYANLG